MDFSILGPLTVHDGVISLTPRGRRQRALLLRLLADADRPVSVDTLVEDLWQGHPPAAADATLKSHVSALRKVIGATRVRTERRGYAVSAEPHEIDARRFEIGVEAGCDALAGGEPAAAIRSFDQVLGLWRGPPFTDADGAGWARPETTRLHELRGRALESLFDARLALGDYTAVVEGAEAALQEHPLREALWARLMVSLYCTGRQADALQAYSRLRRKLGEELGLEPSVTLRELEASMIRGEAIGDLRAGVAIFAREPLPTGTVTVLLTDIVGSTALWEDDAGAMRDALRQHDRVITDVVGRAGGRVLKEHGEGDSTFSVFSVASEAVSAAVALAQQLDEEAWPTDQPVRVRMALHSGEAAPEDGDYRGEIVNRAARLRDLAVGGQILLGSTTAELIVDRLPEGIELLELGVHALRGLRRPETVYSVSAPGLVIASIGGAGAAGGAAVDDVTLPFPDALTRASRACFVGRAGELATAGAMLDDAFDGASGLLFVEGEPGIGKSAFAARVAAIAHARGSYVVFGACDEGLGYAYQPLVEPLEQLVDQAPVALLAAHVAERGSTLARLVPALRRRVPIPAGAPPREPETERALLAGAVVGLLASVAARHPLVLVLDDVHWADQQTLHLLRRLATRPVPGVVVVATYRDVDPGASETLADALTALHREPTVQRLPLRGLAHGEAAELLVATAGGGTDPATVALADELCTDTGGNPLFLNEMLRHSIESGWLAVSDSGAWVRTTEHPGIPTGVQEVLGRRIDRLGSEIGPALSGAAVVGIEFDLDVAAAASGLESNALLEHLDEAIHAGLLHEVEDRPDRFRFDHALVTNVLYERPSTARRRRIHARVADHLDRQGAAHDERIGLLARHRLASAAGSPERLAAADVARRAGERALADLAPDDAASWFERSLDALTAGDECLDENLELSSLVGLGDARRQAGDPGHREILLRAARLARDRHDGYALVRAALANNRGWESHVAELDHDRLAVLRDALAAVGGDDSVERCRLLATLAMELLAGDDRASVDAARQEAVAMARRLGDDQALLHALQSAITGWFPQTLDDRLRWSAEAVALARALDDPSALHAVATHRVAASIQAADLDDADAHVELAAAAAERTGFPSARWAVSGTRAWRALLAGDLTGAEELAETNLALGTAAGEPDAFTVYGAIVLGIRVHQGRSGEFTAMLENLAETNPRVSAFRASLAFAHADSDRVEQAAEILGAAATAGFADIPDDELRLPAIALWAAVAGFARDAEIGTRLADLLAPWCGQVVMTGTGVLGTVDHFAGVARLASGSPDAACALFERAAGTNERVAAPFLQATTSYWWGVAEGERAEADRSADLVRAAHSLASAHGYAAIERHCTDQLARLDPRRIVG